MAENEAFRSLYENEFTNIIAVMESTDHNRLNKLDSLIYLFSSKEQDIRNTQSATKEADYEFTNKYHTGLSADSTN